jgi:DnaK suppressor protein
MSLPGNAAVPRSVGRVRGVVRVDMRAIRSRLEAERRRLAELTGTLSVPSGESKAEASSELGDHNQDPADIASDTLERAKDLSILIGMEAKIADIERALERLAAGTYGVCEACGQPIGEARLEAWPAARFCRTDQARSERRVAPVFRLA